MSDRTRGRERHRDPLDRIADAAESFVQGNGDVRHALAHLQCEVEKIAADVKLLLQGTGSSGDTLGHTRIHLVEVGAKEAKVARDPSPRFIIHSSRNYGVLAVTGPKKADGTFATSGTWKSVDDPATAPADGSAQLALEPVADDTVKDETGAEILDEQLGVPIPVYRVKVLTPLAEDVVAALPGAKAGGTVSWDASGMAGTDCPVEYSDPQLGHTIITGSELPEEG